MRGDRARSGPRGSIRLPETHGPSWVARTPARKERKPAWLSQAVVVSQTPYLRLMRLLSVSSMLPANRDEGVEMSTATVHPIASVPTDLDGEVRHIRDLVFVRRLLGERGATAAELAECDATIRAARVGLAESARLLAERYASAA